MKSDILHIAIIYEWNLLQLASYEVSNTTAASRRPGSKAPSSQRSHSRSRTVDIPHIGVATQVHQF